MALWAQAEPACGQFAPGSGAAGRKVQLLDPLCERRLATCLKVLRLPFEVWCVPGHTPNLKRQTQDLEAGGEAALTERIE